MRGPSERLGVSDANSAVVCGLFQRHQKHFASRHATGYAVCCPVLAAAYLWLAGRRREASRHEALSRRARLAATRPAQPKSHAFRRQLRAGPRRARAPTRPRLGCEHDAGAARLPRQIRGAAAWPGRRRTGRALGPMPAKVPPPHG